MLKTFCTIILALVALLAFQAFAGTTSDNKAKGKAFLQQNKQLEGVKTTASGLQYLILKKGTGLKHPRRNSKVKVHYHGTFLDGTVFDSSIERDKPATFRVNQVIKGWSEGLQLMVEGDKVRFFIPSKLAYGNRKTGNIPGGSTLIFDVELLLIRKY